jgi:hypothetical protein
LLEEERVGLWIAHCLFAFFHPHQATIAMDLSEDIVKGLGLLSTRKTADGASAISDSVFQRLATACFDILLQRTNEEAIDARMRPITDAPPRTTMANTASDGEGDCGTRVPVLIRP